MPIRSVFRSLSLGSVVVLTGVGFAPALRAQTCASDSDCPQSYMCAASGAIVDPPPACPADVACPEPVSDAAPLTIHVCEPKTCVADADCGSGMICYTQTGVACSGGSVAKPCPANTACDAGSPATTETCTTTTTKQCAFTWQVPCNHDADCGAGFTCEPSVSGVCSGGSASGGGAGTPVDLGTADAALPLPPVSDGGAPITCTTTSSFPGSCQPKATTCSTDSDCPAAWKCSSSSGAEPEPVSNGPSSSTDGGSAGAKASPPPASDAAPPVDAGPKICVSPFGGYAYPTAGSTSSTAPTTLGGPGSASDAGATSGQAGGAAGTASAHGADGAGASSGGCSLGGSGPSPATLVLLALASLIAAVRRRHSV